MKLTKLMKRYKAVGIGALIIFILGFAFWRGGDSPSLRPDEPSYRNETAQPSENKSDKPNDKDDKNDFKASNNSETEQDSESVKSRTNPQPKKTNLFLTTVHI